MNINYEEITGREAYIQWRTAWKEDYKSLSEKIRLLKLHIKNTAKAGEYTGTMQNSLRSLQSEANSTLETLKEAKAFAVLQRAKNMEHA